MMRAGLVGLTLVALGLRLPRLGEALYGDELFTAYVATRPTLGAVLRTVAGDLEVTPPLYFAAAHVFAKLGDSEVLIRMPALIAGVACVPLTYLVGRRALGSLAGLVGAGFWAVSPFAVSFSVEARAYTLMTALVLLSTWALLKALDHGRRRWWALFVLCAGGALLSHYTAALLLAAQAVWAIVAHRDRLRALVAANAGAALVFAPWAPYLAEDRGSGFQAAIDLVFPFTPRFVAESMVRWVGGHQFVPVREVPGVPSALLLAVAAALIAVGLATIRPRRIGEEPPSWR